MSKKEKLLAKFLNKSKTFSYDELIRLLRVFGYNEIKTVKTSGSRVAFVNDNTKHIIRLHKPHPDIYLKRYQTDLIEDELRKMELI